VLLGIGKIMMDKEWLDKVKLASKAYEEMFAHQAASVDTFVNWLYAAYGIVPPEQRTPEVKKNASKDK